MTAIYLVLQAVSGPVLGAVAAATVGVALFIAVDRLDVARSWRIGAEGERKTASYLAELEPAGFIVRHDRRVPGYGGNVDHIAMGPSGVWVIETKSYRGSVEIFGDKLEVNGQPRDRIVDQVYKEAVALQIALGDRLSSIGVTVRPVLCLHRAKLGWFDRAVRGVQIVDGRGLAKLLSDGQRRLADEQITGLAAEVDRLFPPAVTS
ncbi:MAG TPA: nuclease-related domain-containing protein [Candidatus Limnocylindria bacterium]|nr:nuclease-related domain-containing protein [Candidatus Limnocylindria bacterium]